MALGRSALGCRRENFDAPGLCKGDPNFYVQAPLLRRGIKNRKWKKRRILIKTRTKTRITNNRT